LWFLDPSYSPRLSDQYSKALLGLITNPSTLEAIPNAKFYTLLCAFRNYGDVRKEAVKMLPLS
jgi:hypothetical protein